MSGSTGSIMRCEASDTESMPTPRSARASASLPWRMPTQDEEIARYLRDAQASGELRRIPGYGQPLAEPAGWAETPDELRMPFKILKDAGFAPPEVAWFHERAELTVALRDASDAQERAALMQRLSELEQKIAVRLEALRGRGSL